MTKTAEVTARKIETLDALRRATAAEAKVSALHPYDRPLNRAVSARFDAAWKAAVEAGTTYAERDLVTEMGAYEGSKEAEKEGRR